MLNSKKQKKNYWIMFNEPKVSQKLTEVGKQAIRLNNRSKNIALMTAFNFHYPAIFVHQIRLKRTLRLLGSPLTYDILEIPTNDHFLQKLCKIVR